MNATQALEAAMKAGREDEGFQRALDYQHELIGNAASQGRREAGDGDPLSASPQFRRCVELACSPD